jgi:CheY-like chemotaxis protein
MNLDFKHLVLIDDNEINNYYHEDLIQELGFDGKISVFTDPTEALTFFEEILKNDLPFPGLLLVDVNMPEMDGFEMIDELEEMIDFSGKTKFPKIAILTTSNHKRDHEQFKKTRFAGLFLNKPIKDEDMKTFFTEI